MTTGVCNAVGISDLLPLTGKLREAIGPVRVDSVGGGSVDDLHIGILYKRNRFHGCRVRKAQEHDIRAVDGFLPGDGILAQGFRKTDDG